MHQKVIRHLTLILFLLGAFSLGSMAQACSADKPRNIVLIDTNLFGDATIGIPEYVRAAKLVYVERFGTEVRALQIKFEGLSREIRKTVDLGSMGTVEIDEKKFRAKIEEAERIRIELENAQKQLRADYDEREKEVLGPIQADIQKSIATFAKEKCYAIILDKAKLGESQIILAIDERVDVTREFIRFYNSRKKDSAPKP